MAEKEPKYSAGRSTLATVFPTGHGLIAAKKGKKLRTAGKAAISSVGGGVLGGTAGGLAGLALTRGKSVKAVQLGQAGGSAAGSYGGAYGAFRSSNRQGYFKPQKQFQKSLHHVSAFGIEH
jgi:hypothetical protein